jgi:hypothetical protein
MRDMSRALRAMMTEQGEALDVVREAIRADLLGSQGK